MNGKILYKERPIQSRRFDFGTKICQAQSDLCFKEKDPEGMGLFYDNDRIIRCVGRMVYGELKDDPSTPIILSRNSRITSLS